MRFWVFFAVFDTLFLFLSYFDLVVHIGEIIFFFLFKLTHTAHHAHTQVGIDHIDV